MSAVPSCDLYTAAAVRELDRLTIESVGVPGEVLMERAGAAAYAALRRHWGQARRIAVACGVGNNAGDGYVIGRLAAQAGLDVQVLECSDPERLRGDARTARDKLERAGVHPTEFQLRHLESADVVVDGLFGTGLDRDIEGHWAQAVSALNEAPGPVLALDIPSGLDADTGTIRGVAVRAAVTTTFVGLKRGLFTGLGPTLCGTVEYCRIGVPDEVFSRVSPAARLLSHERVRHLLQPRPRHFHKGDCGHVLVVGGDYGYAGAARLAGEAAARVGAGLVSVATRQGHATAHVGARPELMVHGIESTELLEALLARASVVVLGPGLGRSQWGRAMWRTASGFDGPLVVDADGLNLLADTDLRNEEWILTPHPGEAARLLKASTADVQSDRFSSARRLVEHYGGTIVLKGVGTLVVDGTASPEVCIEGNPGMASGGMGDVLSGVLGALLAQGLDGWSAARLGVAMHAAAADRAALGGERGLLASDLMPELRALANVYR